MRRILIFLILAGIIFFAWFAWLSPTNGKSPFINELQTTDGDESVFRTDYFGNVYYVESRCHAFGCSSWHIRLPGEKSDEFTVLSRYYGKSNHRVYEGKSDRGKIKDLTHFDATTFEVLSDNGPSVVRDENNVYYDDYRVWGVTDTSTFSIITTPSGVNRINNRWFKDRNNVYYGGMIVYRADPESIELLPPEFTHYTKAKDKNFVYDASGTDLGKIRSCSSSQDCTVDLRLDE